MNGSNGFGPGGYGAPPSQSPGYAPPQQGGYGGQDAYGAPPPQQGYAPPPSPYGAAPSPYGAAPQPAYGAQTGYGPPQPQYPQQAMGMNGMGMAPPKNPGLAVALELIGGTTVQTFGIGHLYAGNTGMGLGLMFGYWALTAINFLLCFVIVGFITWPLTWVAFMILSGITANNAAKRANARAMGQAFG